MQLAGNVVLLIFGSICFKTSYYYVYPAVSAFQKICFVFSEPIEVRVALMIQNELTGCTVTEYKCSRIT